MRPSPRLVLPLLLVFALIAGGCVRRRAALPANVLVVSQEQQASWVRNFNPLTTATSARWPALAGIYESLFVFNSVRGQMVPWLATAREWREANRVLRVTTRPGVLWSDGQPFSARDVDFTPVSGEPGSRRTLLVMRARPAERTSAAGPG